MPRLWARPLTIGVDVHLGGTGNASHRDCLDAAFGRLIQAGLCTQERANELIAQRMQAAAVAAECYPSAIEAQQEIER